LFPFLSIIFYPFFSPPFSRIPPPPMSTEYAFLPPGEGGGGEERAGVSNIQDVHCTLSTVKCWKFSYFF
jgi:hypothetical protein